jgi:hypothetical protein
MKIYRAITLAGAAALTVLTLIAPRAGAHPTRELLASFGSLEGESQDGGSAVVDGVTGLAVDLETGNVYVADNRTQTVYVFGATGGAPADDVPSQITGIHINKYFYPSGVAVDNSCYEHVPRLTGKACTEYDPSYGDVYVMDNENLGGHTAGVQKFELNAKDEYMLAGEIDHEEGQGNGGVTVDSYGNVYEVTFGGSPAVVEYKKIVERVVNGGLEEFQERLEELSYTQDITEKPGFVAVDEHGDIYVGGGQELGGPAEGFKGVAKLKIDESGGVASEEVLAGHHSGALFRPVAVEPSTGEVYVGDGSEVAEYNQAGELQLMFGSSEPLGGSLGEGSNGAHAIAVNGPAGLVYVANELRGDVDVFGGVVSPPVVEASQPAASAVTRTSALIAGTANPEGRANYYFEYVAAGEYEPSAADPYGEGGRTAVQSFAGDSPETVEGVALTGLSAGMTYHYRMVVSNASTTAYGPDETFTTAPATPPVASTGPASSVGATSAKLSGTVDPRGLPTSYVFEVGTDTGYGGAKLFGDAGSSTGEVPVTVALQYLVPGVTYHYRLVATSFDGTSYGRDGTFTTPGVPSTVTQPASQPLIASPVEVFPSIAGAITKPVGAGGSKKKTVVGARGLKSRLGACRKHDRPGRRRAACEAQARKAHGRTLVNQRSKKKR